MILDMVPMQGHGGSVQANQASKIAAVALLIAWGPGCNRESSPEQVAPAVPWFVECAVASGMVFEHDSGCAPPRLLFPETVCGGAGLVDLDNDGDLDAVLIQSGAVPGSGTTRSAPSFGLFRNRGDGAFEDITPGSGLDHLPGYGMGLAAGDYDNDGDVDLYVTALGRNTLLRNEMIQRGGASDAQKEEQQSESGTAEQGRIWLVDVTDAAGAGGAGWSSSAAFVDYDRDGDLDLFVVNYVDWSLEREKQCRSPGGAPDYCSPTIHDAPTSDTLYRNNGDGTFSEVTIEAGIAAARGNGLGVVCADFNGDGWIDIFVANDATWNHLWINQGNGRFVNEAAARGCAIDHAGRVKAGMGVDAVDLDDDGREDLLIVNLQGETDSLFHNDGGQFVDITARAGLGTVSRGYTRFGVGLVDFDHDGVLDLYEANGRVRYGDRWDGDDPFAEPNLLFRGERLDGVAVRFTEVRPRGGTVPALVATSRAAAFGDIDDDGDIDILVCNRDGPAHLLRNVRGVDGAVRHDRHWIRFRLLERHGRDALGATITMSVAGPSVTRRVRSAASYAAASDPRIHLGLGLATAVQDVGVHWPDGESEVFGAFPCDQVITLRQGHGARGVPLSSSRGSAQPIDGR